MRLERSALESSFSITKSLLSLLLIYLLYSSIKSSMAYVDIWTALRRNAMNVFYCTCILWFDTENLRIYTPCMVWVNCLKDFLV